ncbi:hypothetical protein CR513_26673, partial [Mucuna pruriens]
MILLVLQASPRVTWQLSWTRSTPWLNQLLGCTFLYWVVGLRSRSASNNQAEYEALLAGMRLARELEAKVLTAKNDSKLVTGQVNEKYQARDPQLIAATFEKFMLLHVPRDHNERADLLAKLASTQKRGQQKLVIHESLSTPTVDRQEV